MIFTPVLKLSKVEYDALMVRKIRAARPAGIYSMTRDLKPGEAFHVQTTKERPPSQVYAAAKESKFKVAMRHGANRVGQEGYWVIRPVA